jgi:hypothetical protein
MRQLEALPRNKTRWKIFNLYRSCEFIYAWLLIAILFICGIIPGVVLNYFLGWDNAAVIIGVAIGVASFLGAAFLLFNLHCWLEEKLYYWALNEKKNH